MRRTRKLKFTALAATSAVFFLFAWENIQAVKLGYRIEQLRKDNTDLENANTYLKKEIQISLSPEKLEAEALKLGMVYPEPSSIVQLDSKPEDKTRAFGWLARLLRRLGGSAQEHVSTSKTV
ncbi:MAG: hypothetical protein A2021_05610 [Elusimicrobia bacterium GWF2_52_66]|nr:MAG: hypothetical protein A2021_05610 [Elusimicrobia bacterium GWF2_52_66]HAF95671.1 hypothetical protein [Elusimicrobiota bacterium]